MRALDGHGAPLISYNLNNLQFKIYNLQFYGGHGAPLISYNLNNLQFKFYNLQFYGGHGAPLISSHLMVHFSSYHSGV